MKKKIAIFIVVCIILSHTTAAEWFSNDSGSVKFICSSWALSDSDFENTDFFLRDINKPYYRDFNVQIFQIIKSKLNNQKGTDETDLSWLPKEIKRRGEFIMFFPYNEKDGRVPIFYAKWNKNKNTFTYYKFWLTIDKTKYNAYETNIHYYDKCIKNIEWCNWVLENCSSPTLREAEAYNNRPRYDTVRTTDGYGNSTYKSTGISRPNISTSNPNYDPDKVAEAKRLLPQWKQEKTNTEKKLEYLPFRIELP